MENRSRFEKHDIFQDEIMSVIRKYVSDGHVPDIRIMVNKVVLSVDFKTTRNVEANSRNMYFYLQSQGERVAIIYNDRPYEAAETGIIRGAFISDLTWTGPIPASIKSRSGDPYYKISGGVPYLDFIKSIR